MYTFSYVNRQTSTSVYPYKSVLIYAYMYVGRHVYMHRYTHYIYACIHMYEYIYVYMYIGRHAWTYMCEFVYINTHIMDIHI